MIKEKLERFLNIWNAEVKAANKIMTDNKAYNLSLKSSGLGINEYEIKKRTYQTSAMESHGLLNDISHLIYSKSSLSNRLYIEKASIGAGNLVEIPWICIFDKEITSSAQNGYYIGFLFQSNMNGFYVSLNQGWTQYENKFGIKKGKIEIQSTANKLKKHLRGVQGFSFDPIKLYANGSLGKGYEVGNICSKYYSIDNIPEDQELIDDVRNLIGIYRELKGIVGKDILNIKSTFDEDEFQELIQSVPSHETDNIHVGVPIKRPTSGSSWLRSSSVANLALKNAEFKCENAKEHFTFISKKSGYPFVEAHHLIPMEYQNEFEYSIDVPENIISLCPNCHRAFHNSTDSTKIELLSKFIKQRELSLSRRGIEIDLEKLFSYYQVE